MNSLLILIPIAVFLGLLGLVAFMWALQNGQFDDLEGAAYRILFDAPHDDGAVPVRAVPTRRGAVPFSPDSQEKGHGERS